MEDNSLSDTSNTVESKKKETNKERPKSLDLESLDYSNEEEDTSKKAKDLASSPEDFLSSRSAEPESPDEGDDASQRSSSRSKSIASSLKSKIRDLSPSRRTGTPTSERKPSKGKSPLKLNKSPGNWLPASFNQIFSSYKTKCGDFRRLFKDLPDSEQLIVDYSCALQRDILVHGRLYISQNWLCFYANIFGWETFVTVQCTEISSIRKEKTALVIPNAIQICTESEKYFFASFISRDTAYTVLFRIWQNALLDQPLSPSELIQMVGKYSEPQHNASSENDDSEDEEKQVLSDSEIDSDNDQELNSDSVSSLSQGQNEMANENISTESQAAPRKDSENAPVVSITPPSPGVFPPSTAQGGASPSREDGDPAGAAERQSQQAPSSPRRDLQNFLKSPKPKRKIALGLEDCQPPKEREAEGSSGLDEEGTASDFHDDELTEVPVNCPCDSHLVREFVNEEFPVVVDTLYEYLFTESDFYKRVQKARRTKDLLFTSWEKTEDGQRRTMTYTVSLNHAIGPKHSSTTEQQHCLLGSIPGRVYVVRAEVSNEGIPYGDSFSVVNRYCITRSSSMTSRLRVTAEVKYHKSVWGFVKNMIEKNANEALESYFQFLAESLRTETTLGQWPAKKRKVSPTRRHKRTRSLKSKEEVIPTSESSTEVQSTLLQRLSTREAMSSLLGVRLRFPQIKVENRLSVVVTILLGALLVLNMVLVYRMLLLEQAAYTRVRWDGTLQDLPTDVSEWAKLLQQQRNVQGIEMKRWRDVLTSSIELMNQVQKSLDALQEELSREQTTGTLSPT